MPQLTLTMSTENAARVIAANNDKFPKEQYGAEAVSDADWVKQCIIMELKRMVAQYERKKAVAAIPYVEDNNLLS